METLFWLEGDKLRRGNLWERFSFTENDSNICPRDNVIAITGAGGKTTLLFALAALYSRQGFKTGVTTSTHIMYPKDGSFCENLRVCETRWHDGLYATRGQVAENRKLRSLSETDFQAFYTAADIVLVEADGAKRMPCKVPAAHEPQIPAQAHTVLACLGLDALGKPLEQVCFRLEEAQTLLHCTVDHCLTVEDFVKILTSEQGLRKNVGERNYHIILNKCDNLLLRADGLRILQLLREQGHTQSTLSCFRLWNHG